MVITAALVPILVISTPPSLKLNLFRKDLAKFEKCIDSLVEAILTLTNSPLHLKNFHIAQKA